MARGIDGMPAAAFRCALGETAGRAALRRDGYLHCDCGAPGQDDARWLQWPFTLSGSALLLAGIGIALRLGMLGIGVLRLRGIARRADTIQPLTEPLRRAGLMAGCEVRFCWSDEVVSPVTFGFHSPVVLLPPDFVELGAAEQASVALHEAMHVQRRDWVYTICEEMSGLCCGSIPRFGSC